MSGATGKVSLNVSDIEIGAVEIKDRSTDNRASIVDLNTIFPSLPPNTYFGLVIGGEVAVVNDANVPFNIHTVQNILNPVNVQANQWWDNFYVVNRKGYTIYLLFGDIAVTSDNWAPIISWGYPYGTILVEKHSIEIVNSDFTNSLDFKITGAIAVPDAVEVVSPMTLGPQQRAVIHLVDENWEQLQIWAKRTVTGANAAIRGGIWG